MDEKYPVMTIDEAFDSLMARANALWGKPTTAASETGDSQAGRPEEGSIPSGSPNFEVKP